MPKRFADRDQTECCSQMATLNLYGLCSKAVASNQSRRKSLIYKSPCSQVTMQKNDMLPSTFFHTASSIMQIKKVHIRLFAKGICLKSTFLNKSALSRLGHWWLIFNHYKLAHFCFLSHLHWVKFLLYPRKKLISGFIPHPPKNVMLMI